MRPDSPNLLPRPVAARILSGMTSQVAGTDDAVSRVADMLRVGAGMTKAELAETTGIPLRTLSRRLNGGGHWEWREVAALAVYFNVPMAVFYNGPGALMSGGPGGQMSSQFTSEMSDLIAA
jgi:DNA-binding XRE family transcriptional regulator